MSLAGELLKHFEHMIDHVTLVPSDGGRFEVTINGKLMFSKLEAKRHVQPGEIVGLVNRMVEG